jgi:hypothetical protein
MGFPASPETVNGSTSNRTGEDRIWKIPASGGKAVQVTNSVGYTPLESPDGAYLYYVQSVFTPGPLWCMPVSGGDPVKVVEGVVLGNFVVLEKGIYYIDRPSGEESIYWIDRPSGKARLQYFEFATAKPGQWLPTWALWTSHSRPPQMTARFSIPGSIPPLTT